MTDETLPADLRRVADSLRRAAGDGHAVLLEPASASTLAGVLGRAADRLDADGSAPGVRLGRAMERDDVVRLLRLEADRAEGTRAEEQALGRAKSVQAMCAGAVASALETMAHRITKGETA